jgi:hypothetical protein
VVIVHNNTQYSNPIQMQPVAIVILQDQSRQIFQNLISLFTPKIVNPSYPHHLPYYDNEKQARAQPCEALFQPPLQRAPLYFLRGWLRVIYRPRCPASATSSPATRDCDNARNPRSSGPSILPFAANVK